MAFLSQSGRTLDGVTLRRSTFALPGPVLALLAGLLGFLLVGLLPAATARAATGAQQAAAALASDPLYVHPSTPVRLSAADQQQLRERLRSGSPAVYLTLLPRRSSAQQLTADVMAVGRAAGRAGIYVATDGKALVATSRGTALSSGQAGVVAHDVAARHQAADVTALIDVIDSARAADASGGAAGGAAGDGSANVPSPRSSSPSRLPLLVPLLLLGGVFLLFRSRRGRADRRAQAESFSDIRQASEEDVTELGEDIARLDLDVSDPGLPAETVEDYRGALDSYDRAKNALATASRPEQLGAVSTALEEGRWRMTCVRARLTGQPAPERRPPCFFNPRHGPSVTDVAWEPPGGAERQVPVCAADADRLARGQEPESRQVVVSGHRMPYWQAGPQWGGYAGGYYGGFGGLGSGLLTGLMVGNLLGGGFGGGGDF